MEKQFYTLEEVMELLQISNKQAKGLFHNEEFHGFQVGSSYRVKVDDFNNWVEHMRNGGECKLHTEKY